ncbi:uncharacterized protein N7459_010006 [Penicillium hispanicum]|uniref:uncharacterized protein n=1 Tax=Penicillium hispanicum TaxID=1080232 RepID=UPI002540B6E6|nr:uncharacterized protein N7459_010006 [Penicillium hispanicum]KAJ5570576.1 hypothetical protein N7459_010006 [Penicillium hispanicum]
MVRPTFRPLLPKVPGRLFLPPGGIETAAVLHCGSAGVRIVVRNGYVTALNPLLATPPQKRPQETQLWTATDKMDRDLNYQSAESIGTWYDAELPDGSLFPKDMDHGHAPCKPSQPLSVDAGSHPPRSLGITGALSLHDYRKHLSQSPECVVDPVDRSEKTLKRKTAKSNLARPPVLSSIIPSSSVSVSSSVASSPPPLSPSYSQSIVSQRSEQDEPPKTPLSALAPQGPRVHLVSENATRPRPNRKRLNTFREKIQRTAQARDQAQRSPLARPQTSDSMLADTQAVATISHGGASFEILNPRKSLDVTRIVSYIEDVDACSIFSADQYRDSKVPSNAFAIEQGLDRSSLSQFTDASLPSHYSSHSLYTSPPAGYSTPRQTADIPSSSPGVHDRIRSLSDYSLHESNYWSPDRKHDMERHDKHVYNDLVEDAMHQNMSSVSERLDEGDEFPDHTSSPRSPSSSQPTFYSEGSEIGEPGSPVYANGEWSQVDGRDRGIFFELPPSPYDQYYENTLSPYPRHDDPYDTYYANTMSPFPKEQIAYDPIYFDPHVQSVLAAANAENMGLRGNPARGLDDLQRRFQSSVSLSEDGACKSEDRKQSVSQRKKLRKLFSWRSGN